METVGDRQDKARAFKLKEREVAALERIADAAEVLAVPPSPLRADLATALGKKIEGRNR